MAHRYTGTVPHIFKQDGRWRVQVFANSELAHDLLATGFVFRLNNKLRGKLCP